MIRLSNDIPRIPEFVHYYGDFIWDEELTGWIKSLLLFFDGIALALSPEMADQLIEANPVLAQPLAELGLLRNYEPDSWLRPNEYMLERYGYAFRRVDEIFEHARQTQNAADSQAIGQIFFDDENLHRDLIRLADSLDSAKQKYGDTASQKRALVGGVKSRLLHWNITDVAIQPVIDDEDAASYVAAVIGSYNTGRANIVVGDLAQVGIDLSTVPLDEVLDFRRQYGSEYQRYSSDVRRFTLELSLVDQASRYSAITERRAELEDRAEQLRKIGRTAFARQTIGFGFGLAGAAWTLAHGDPWGASFAAGAAAAGLSRQDPGSIGAGYTYILRAKTELRG
jgi:hypothetical protein